MSVDINADLGEGAPFDDELLNWVTSANIACGVHAGDPALMRRTAEAARRAGVALGAHPGLSDGRRERALSPDEAYAATLDQVRALQAVAGPLRHVKPHGALYNMAARDAALADAIARATRAADPGLVLFGLAGSELVAAGRRAGLAVAEEAFLDRGYERDGSLTPRGRPGALLHDPAAAAARALRIVRDGRLEGVDIPLRADTLCVHGDTPEALAMARALREALAAGGVDVKAFGA
ncbi:MAG TPA: 5-oxoprolinase subunit PxpA [Planctomycetota bacterium]